MRRVISVLSVLVAACAAIVVGAAPAHAWEVTISIYGAGQVTETTEANLVGGDCASPATTPTGVLGDTCAPGDPSGPYGHGWTVRLVATPKPGYRFVHWTTNGSGNPVICDGAGGSPTHTGTACQFATFDNLQTRAVFVDDTAPTMSSLSGPSQLVNGPASFTFSANADPTFRAFECRVAGVHEWQTCSSGHTENPPNGTYTLEVRAYDWSNNRSATLTKTWTVDKVAPDTAITGGPSGTVATNNAQFTFSSNEPGTFTCSLDGSSTSCASPQSYAGLPDGPHTFTVAARDIAGNVDPSPATRTWTVDAVVEDNTSPETSITGGPTGTVTSSTAEFAFTSDEPGGTFTCTLDGSSAPCTSPKTYTGLADGPHTFSVAATDIAGNIDVSPATRTWTVDTTVADTDPPETTITSGPSGTVNSSTAQFAFTADEPGTFSCSLDGTPAACTSPKSYAGLADGPHTFTVAATDGANNTDPTPATRSWTVDTTVADTDPPETTITSGPSGLTNQTGVKFEFGSEPGAGYVCSLDGSTPAACSSPHHYSGLADGAHVFTVAARDATGNQDASPAVRTWTVDTVAPRVTKKKPTGRKVSRAASPQVLFSEAMIASSVTGQRFYLLKGRKKVAAKVTYRRTSRGDYVAILDPKSKLRPKQTYQVVVKGAVDLAGNRVRPASWKFRTKG